jgi:fructose-specific phosphotransferase system IIA component
MQLINEDLVMIECPAASREESIKTMASILDASGRLQNKDVLIQDVFKREEEVSTAMGLDIAIPHARSAGVLDPSLVVLKLKEPITWNEDQVSLVIGIAVPEEPSQGPTNYLKILSSLARQLMDEEFRDRLLKAASNTEIVEAIQSIHM